MIPPIAIAVLAGLATYIGLVALMPKRMLMQSTQYTRSLLQELAQQNPAEAESGEEDLSLLRGQKRSNDFLSRLFFMLPGTKILYPKLLAAGIAENVRGLFIRGLIALTIAAYILKKFFPVNILLAVFLAYAYVYWSVNRRIAKRNADFLNAFPDALDMIVRSVRSGYPLNSAVRMVADNMQPPVSIEFKQVADEIAYGSTMIEALQRLAQRINEPDVHFFVVVLTVQQDIGGNLSEILHNLADIIRKRKHLRMKIKALTSEGRTTAWILGSMPFCEAALILLVSPKHLNPLFDNPLGNMVLIVTVCVVALGAFIVTRMVNIKV